MNVPGGHATQLWRRLRRLQHRRRPEPSRSSMFVPLMPGATGITYVDENGR